MSNLVERFGKNAILKLQVEGFDDLDLQKKHLIYYLSEAGLHGRDLFFLQNYKHNLLIKNTLESIYIEIMKKQVPLMNKTLFDNFVMYLKEFWLNVGIYNSFNNKFIDVRFSKEELVELIKMSGLKIGSAELTTLNKVFFDKNFTKKFKNIQEEGVDVIAESGGNFYEDLNNNEVDLYRKALYLKTEDMPQFGFNVKLKKEKSSRNIKPNNALYPNSLLGIANAALDKYNEELEKLKMIKNDPKSKENEINDLFILIEACYKMKKENEKKNNYYIKEYVICESGLYGEYVKKINENLFFALEYVENEQQKESIETLINFYKTGKAEDFDKHSLAWVKDKESEVFFINGLIESYDDPKGVACSYESIVAFKNPEQTKKVNNIIGNIQWFENNLPVSKEFKKESAVGLSASSVTVSSMAGDSSPQLPLGICLPNSDWIRAKYGSKSVNLANVHNARGGTELDVKSKFFLSEYIDGLMQYGSISGSLHTDLHEVAGHGSCKNLEGVSNKDLDIYYSVIEETRADLVGLYFINVPELKTFGILDEDVDLKVFGDTQYVNYITNGVLLQLKRVELGSKLAQPHLRNRQLISNWILEKAKETNCVELIKVDNNTFVKLNDFDKLRELFGELLSIIQRVKSTGNLNEARILVENYGTTVDYDLHSEVLERFSNIDSPNVFGFTTPIFFPVFDRKGDVCNYHIHSKNSFIEDQLYLSSKYN